MGATRRANEALLAVVCALGIAAPGVAGADDGRGATYRVFALECELPIPIDFVLNTRETTHFAWFIPGTLTPLTRITISAYRGDLNEVLESIEARKVGDLTVEELRFRQSTGDERNDRVFRIHDGKQQVTIYAGSRELVDSLVDECLRTMAR